MSKVVMHKLEMHNFMSVGNDPVIVYLDQAPTTLISGANGSGKSLIIDGITFALFGKSYRGVNKNGVMNSVNQRNMVIRLTFMIGQDTYVVERGAKPTKFNIYLNDKKLKQDGSSNDFQARLESILGFTYKSFCQTCMIGSSDYVPFMRLTAQARRQMIEELLDIGVFSDMNKVLKQRIKDWKEEKQRVGERYRLRKAEYDNELKWIESHNDDVETRQKEKEDQIDALLERRKEVQKRVDELDRWIGEQSVEELNTRLSKLKNQQKSLQNDIGQSTRSVKNAKEQIEFFQSNETCPTCEQEIDEGVAKSAINKYVYQGKQAGQYVKTLSNQRDGIVDDIHDLENAIDRLKNAQNDRQHLAKDLESIDDQITQREAEHESITAAQIDQTHLKELAGEIKYLAEREKELADQHHLYTYAESLLKDSGIKASIIRQYLPILNAKVNQFLQTLSFNVKFELDEEFNESLMARFRDEFTYANFSMGERQRMDMSLLFAWRDVAKMKNSVNTNVLFLDETLDQSLDEEATNALLSIVEQVSENHNVFIVSHKTQLEDKLDRHISIQKVNGFTKTLE